MNEDGYSDRAMRIHWEPKVNNFCAYWRATSIRMLLILALFLLCTIAVAGLGFLIYKDPVGAAMGFGTILFIFLVAALLLASFTYVPKYFKKASDSIEKSDSLFVTKYKSFKSKICPGVEYND